MNFDKINGMEMNEKMIEERNELFDSAVREQLTGYEPPVPHALWTRIASELDNGTAATETPAPIHRSMNSSRNWKMAIAAAMLLTLTVGTLLYTMNPATGVKGMSTNAVAKQSTPAATAPKAVATPATVQATSAKMVAQTAPVGATHKALTPAVVSSNNTTASAGTAAVATDRNVTISPVDAAAPELTAQDLEFVPATTENRPVEVGNIPLASLNFLSTPNSVNDEITVIKSTDKKRRHARKSDDESTKVIMIGKKFESRPDIRYQMPVRF